MGKILGVLDQTPIGPVSLMAGDGGLEKVVFSPLMAFKQSLSGVDDQPSLAGMEVISTLLAELSEYFFGLRKSFSVPINWDVMTRFQKDVLQLTIEIPFGDVRTYGDIARQLGKPGASRAVGTSLARNPMPLVVPCHRVVGSDYKMRGFAGPDGIKTKVWLLELEGHDVTGDKLVG